MNRSLAVSFYEEIEDETSLSSDVSDNMVDHRSKNVRYEDDPRNRKSNRSIVKRRKKDKTAQKLKEIEDKIKEIQLLREKLKPTDPFQSINKRKKKSKISSNDSISSATASKSKSTKLKLNHPHLEIVLGELMYSPYMISPAAKYPTEIYEIPKQLHKIKLSGKEFKDLPVASVPYNVEEIELKFIEDILNFKPTYFGTKPLKSPSTTLHMDDNSHNSCHDASYYSKGYNSKSNKSNKPRKLPPIKTKKYKRKSTPKDNSSVYTPCSTISDSDASSIYSLFSNNDMERNYNDWNGIGDRLSSSAGQRRGDKNSNVAFKVNKNATDNLDSLKYDYVDVCLIEKQFTLHNIDDHNNNYSNEYYEDDWEDWEKQYEKSREDINCEPKNIRIIENNTEIEYISINIPVTNGKEADNQELVINNEKQQNITVNAEMVSKDVEYETDIEAFHDTINNMVDAVEKRNVISAATRRTTEFLIDDILSNLLNRLMSR